MLFSARMSLKNRAALCRRLATALTAGIDIRKIFAREAENARNGSARRRLTAVSEAVAQGESMTAALEATGDYFPPLLREMVEVGEQTGHLGEIFGQLAEHYENQARLRRNFLGAITWPIIQLTIAIGVVGLLIWIGGVIGQRPGAAPIDFLGFGLVGDRGVAIYFAFIATVAALIGFTIFAVSRGLIWGKALQRVVQHIPVLGVSLQTLALSRLAWTMHLTLNAGMGVRKALRLSLRNTGSIRFTDAANNIDKTIAEGQSIHEAFREAGCFPADFLDSVDVGEHSGRLVESMAHLSQQYQEQARAALATLTMIAGLVVWGLVAILIITLIFRLAFFYIGVLNGAAQGIM
jgi:type II secretory pathway component PulF